MTTIKKTRQVERPAQVVTETVSETNHCDVCGDEITNAMGSTVDGEDYDGIEITRNYGYHSWGEGEFNEDKYHVHSSCFDEHIRPILMTGEQIAKHVSAKPQETSP